MCVPAAHVLIIEISFQHHSCHSQPQWSSVEELYQEEPVDENIEQETRIVEHVEEATDAQADSGKRKDKLVCGHYQPAAFILMPSSDP